MHITQRRGKEAGGPSGRMHRLPPHGFRDPAGLLPTVNEMMAAHKNAVVIANIRQKNQPLVVPRPVGRLIIFDTERTGLVVWTVHGF